MWRATRSPVTGLGNQRVCPSFLLPEISDGSHSPGHPGFRDRLWHDFLESPKGTSTHRVAWLQVSCPLARCLSIAVAVTTQGISGFPLQALPPATNLSGDPPILEHPPTPRSLKSETETAPSKSD